MGQSHSRRRIGDRAVRHLSRTAENQGMSLLEPGTEKKCTRRGSASSARVDTKEVAELVSVTHP